MDKKYKQLLHDVGLKATPARGDILKLFDRTKKPLNVAQIKRRFQNVDVATIYRIVDVFVSKGIVRSIHVCGSSRLFELTVLPHHHHIVCKKCGMIEDVDECYLSSVIEKIVKSSKKFENISEHTFELFGLCKKCD